MTKVLKIKLQITSPMIQTLLISNGLQQKKGGLVFNLVLNLVVNDEKKINVYTGILNVSGLKTLASSLDIILFFNNN